jgi:hypothetical protein
VARESRSTAHFPFVAISETTDFIITIGEIRVAGGAARRRGGHDPDGYTEREGEVRGKRNRRAFLALSICTR